MSDALAHYKEAQRLLAATPAGEDEQEEWTRVRSENIAAAAVHAHLADVALTVELEIMQAPSDAEMVYRRRREWIEAFDGS